MPPNPLVWIGSLTKSMAAITILQLVEEGKLDLHRPVLDILPGLRIKQPFGPITTHHLLTHSSGLPDWLRETSADPAEFPVQAYAPGRRYQYCNLGFDILGRLVEYFDSKPWSLAVRDRIFLPLGMNASVGSIAPATLASMPVAWHEFYRDRPTSDLDPLAPVAPLDFSLAAGCCAVTPSDMLLYLACLANAGASEGGRILSPESFEKLATPHIKAPDLGESISYGYGIAVEQRNGHRCLQHEGGAVGFSSSMFVDTVTRSAAFACLNSRQGHWPTDLVRYAVDLENGVSAAPPPLPKLSTRLDRDQQLRFTGEYYCGSVSVSILVEAGSFAIRTSRGTSPLLSRSANTFAVADGSVLFARTKKGIPGPFALMFGEGLASATFVIGPYVFRRLANGNDAAPPAAKRAAVDVYTGKYVPEGQWFNWIRIVERGGKLWMNGIVELSAAGIDRFSIPATEGSYLAFQDRLLDHFQALRLNGELYRRSSEEDDAIIVGALRG